MPYKLAIEVEGDDCGFHAVVIDVADDSILRVTTSYSTPESAEQDAQDWIDQNQ